MSTSTLSDHWFPQDTLIRSNRPWDCQQSRNRFRDRQLVTSTANASESLALDTGEEVQAGIVEISNSQHGSGASINGSERQLPGQEERHSLGLRSPAKLGQCRDTLRRVFMACSQEQFSNICCAISCVLNSSRPMLLRELDGAVCLHIRHERVSSQVEQRKSMEMDWWTRCELLFEENTAGLVRFALPAMAWFLRKYRIRGIDASSKTLALLCLDQMELDGAAQRDDSRRVWQRSPFSVYAEQNWRRHCREAERSSLAVRSARARLATARTRLGRPGVGTMIRTEAADPVSIGDVSDVFAELDVSNEMQDWVIVDSQ